MDSSTIKTQKLEDDEYDILTTEYRWFPHLKDAVPPAGQGKRISTYTIALEGWRRGLDLKFYSVFEDGNKMKLRYALSNKERTHHFSLSMGDKVTKEAFNICNDKELTKKYLRSYGVPVPEGKMFDSSVEISTILDYAKELGFPLVIKPTDGNAGRGVFANILDLDYFKDLLLHVREELGFKNIIVERYHPGEEFRVVVIEDKVLGAINRRPASVVGDGFHTIRQLIHQKNAVRKTNPHLASRLIKIDKEIEALLKKQSYTLSSIPNKGERVFLREKSNLSAGGDSIDVTDQLTDELKKIAINAGRAIPGLKHYGIDMIVDKENNTGVILEVNARPGFGGHLFPVQGEPRDLAKELIDYYFPETKNNYRSPLYFDFDRVIEPIKNRSATSVNVMPVPKGELYGKQYIISGDFDVRSMRRWIRRHALIREFHGFIKQTEANQLHVVIMGTTKRDVDSFVEIFDKEKVSHLITKIEESDYQDTLLIGFHTTSLHTYSQTEIKGIVKENEQLKRERDIMQKRYIEIKNSRAWKATFPVRFTLYHIKHLFRRLGL